MDGLFWWFLGFVDTGVSRSTLRGFFSTSSAGNYAVALAFGYGKDKQSLFIHEAFANQCPCGNYPQITYSEQTGV